MGETADRPAFYALSPGGWRDYWSLLHPPYTAWHLSYVVIGACIAPAVDVGWLVETLVAFFLAMGLAAHALDELNGRPLKTSIPTGVLAALAGVSIGAAAVIGLVAALEWTAWLLPFVIFGAFIVFAYNLELFGGRFHSNLWFALAWGAFPVLTAYVGATEKLRPEAILAAAFAASLSLAQRHLSTQVRNVRRRATQISGRVVYADGRDETVDANSFTPAPEAALRALTYAVVAVAATLLALHTR